MVREWISCFRFPDYILEEEEEPEKSVKDIPETINNTIGKVEPGDEDLEHEDETESEVDKQFLKFQKRISRAPDQVLRYGRVNPHGHNEEPLWVSDIQMNPVIEDCPSCKAPRTFEFQVILISY
jgi:pre-rRNA-processing protein TSR4